jgi:potassium-transporting ATPase KdpC subunit
MNMMRLFFILTFLTGIVYPLGVTLISKFFFSEEASGSLIQHEGKTIGSKLIAQKFEGPGFFHSRPSAADYATVASGASQASPTHLEAREKRENRRKEFPDAGVDFWTTSASGLDPHLSPSSALSQISRIEKIRNLSKDTLTNLVMKYTEGPTWGIWGQPRVNVLELNIALLKEVNVHTGSAPQKP